MTKKLNQNMNVPADIKKQIDAMDYVELLRLWRFSPAGHPWFTNKIVYNYIRNRMQTLRDEGVDPVAASKEVGWDG